MLKKKNQSKANFFSSLFFYIYTRAAIHAKIISTYISIYMCVTKQAGIEMANNITDKIKAKGKLIYI